MSSTGGRILVVDDKDTMVSLWQRILEPDHKVWTAASGEAAVAMLPAGEFDVVVSDIRMPGIDGFEVLRQVQKLSPGTEMSMSFEYDGLKSRTSVRKNVPLAPVRRPATGMKR